MAAFTVATPSRAGQVLDRYGHLCSAATPNSYPLRAVCEHCDTRIQASDGQGSWWHWHSGQMRCS